jgi:hypothetical protein
MSKKPINVYWCADYSDADLDWSFLYPKPITLFSELIKERNDPKDTLSYFLCPAVTAKFKKILVFNSPMDSSFNFKQNENNKDFSVEPTSEPFLNAEIRRKPTIKDKPTFEFSLHYKFFADESLDVFFSPPYFHEPKYMKTATPMPGEFNIGKWFRPYNLELQTWTNNGSVSITSGEPLFYAEFKTDRPINFYRVSESALLKKYQVSNVRSTTFFERFQTLEEKYEKFKQVGYREKILTEIKKNLIEEEPYKF